MGAAILTPVSLELDNSGSAPGTPNTGRSVVYVGTDRALHVKDDTGTDTAYGAGMPTGAILAYAGPVAPVGWLLCYGQAASRATYAALYAIIGIVYGAGDGTTTFNVPDLRGRVPVGRDNMGGAAANRVVAAAGSTIGSSGGEENHTLTAPEMPGHTHVVNSTYNNQAGAGAHYGVTAVNTNGLDVTGSTGGGSAHNNMQPYLTLNRIIKT